MFAAKVANPINKHASRESFFFFGKVHICENGLNVADVGKSCVCEFPKNTNKGKGMFL